MATARLHTLWKGGINFGLVHIPVSLHSATRESGIDFDWLDKRSMDPVGYKRINKKTGREIQKDNIVRGVEYEDGRYVVLGDDEINAAYPRSTQSIDIEAFVPAGQIPFVFLDRPYYLAPSGKGGKVYALLCEALTKSQKIGIARVVIQTKQHLAALIPSGNALVLNLLRWGEDIRDIGDLPLPSGAETKVNPKELSMATQLIDDMSGKFDPSDYKDTFRSEVMKLVKRKAEAGKLETVSEPLETPIDAGSGNVIDLTELLKQSLGRKGAKAPAKAAGDAEAAEERPTKSAAKGGAAKRAPVKKAARKSASKATKVAPAAHAARKAPARKAA